MGLRCGSKLRINGKIIKPQDISGIIAVDIMIYATMFYKTNVMKWCQKILDFFIQFQNCHFIFIFDGDNKPNEKGKRKRTIKKEPLNILQLYNIHGYNKTYDIFYKNNPNNINTNTFKALMLLELGNIDKIAEMYPHLNWYPDIVKILEKAQPKIKQYPTTLELEHLASYLGQLVDLNELKITDIQKNYSIIANGEAEALCSRLTLDGYADYTFSDDSDVFAYGDDINILRYESKNIVLYNTKLTRKYYNLTLEEFFALCVIPGTDYSTNVLGIDFNILLNEIINGNLYYIINDYNKKSKIKYSRLQEIYS